METALKSQPKAAKTQKATPAATAWALGEGVHLSNYLKEEGVTQMVVKHTVILSDGEEDVWEAIFDGEGFTRTDDDSNAVTYDTPTAIGTAHKKFLKDAGSYDKGTTCSGWEEVKYEFKTGKWRAINSLRPEEERKSRSRSRSAARLRSRPHRTTRCCPSWSTTHCWVTRCATRWTS